MKNKREICPLVRSSKKYHTSRPSALIQDLAPELRRLQETCIENLFKVACSPSDTQNDGSGHLHGLHHFRPGVSSINSEKGIFPKIHGWSTLRVETFQTYNRCPTIRFVREASR